MMKKSTLSLPSLMVISALGGMNPSYAQIHDVDDPLFGPIGTFDDWGFPESDGREAFNPAFPAADKNAKTTLSFGPFTADETGVISWTATITDADPDDDTRIKTTKVE